MYTLQLLEGALRAKPLGSCQRGWVVTGMTVANCVEEQTLLLEASGVLKKTLS